MRLKGAYAEKLFKIIVCNIEVKNTLENIFNSEIYTLFQRNVCKQSLNVKGYHVFALHGEALDLPYKCETPYRQHSVQTEYEAVKDCKGI